MFILFWILCAVVAAFIGGKKGRTGLGIVLGFLLGPFGVLIMFFVQGDRKQCAYCKELMHRDATRCPKCQKDVQVGTEVIRAAVLEKSGSSTLGHIALYVIAALVVVSLIGVLGLITVVSKSGSAEMTSVPTSTRNTVLTEAECKSLLDQFWAFTRNEPFERTDLAKQVLEQYFYEAGLPVNRSNPGVQYELPTSQCGTALGGLLDTITDAQK